MDKPVRNPAFGTYPGRKTGPAASSVISCPASLRSIKSTTYGQSGEHDGLWAGPDCRLGEGVCITGSKIQRLIDRIALANPLFTVRQSVHASDLAVSGVGPRCIRHCLRRQQGTPSTRNLALGACAASQTSSANSRCAASTCSPLNSTWVEPPNRVRRNSAKARTRGALYSLPWANTAFPSGEQKRCRSKK